MNAIEWYDLSQELKNGNNSRSLTVDEKLF
jgi:hypothetical protein